MAAKFDCWLARKQLAAGRKAARRRRLSNGCQKVALMLPNGC